jgi:hypothetical protein
LFSYFYIWSGKSNISMKDQEDLDWIEKVLGKIKNSFYDICDPKIKKDANIFIEKIKSGEIKKRKEP